MQERNKSRPSARASRQRASRLRTFRLRAADRRARSAARRWRHTGDEARWARSDLPARRVMARIASVFFAAGAALFAVLAASAPAAYLGFDAATAVICALCAMVALVDLAVIRRRVAEQRRWGRSP